jgi:hypothetical protein
MYFDCVEVFIACCSLIGHSFVLCGQKTMFIAVSDNCSCFYFAFQKVLLLCCFVWVSLFVYNIMDFTHVLWVASPIIHGLVGLRVIMHGKLRVLIG